jgi:hypothetical protein
VILNDLKFGILKDIGPALRKKFQPEEVLYPGSAGSVFRTYLIETQTPFKLTQSSEEALSYNPDIRNMDVVED